MGYTKKFFVFSSLAVLSSFPLQLQGTNQNSFEQVHHQRVSNILIQVENVPPESSFDETLILEKLKTQKGAPFSPSIFDQDLKTLSEHYDRIEPVVKVQSGEIVISLKVWLRPIIKNIVWEGNSDISSKILAKELSVKPSQPFNRMTFSQHFNKVKEYYIKKGYFESQLSYVIHSIPHTNAVDIHIHIVEGRAGTIDDIIFKGFTKKEKSQILEMIYTKKYNLFMSWITGQGLLNDEAIEQDKFTILNFLHNEGYADAKLDVLITNSLKKGRVNLTVTAKKGALFHIGDVSFQGNSLFSDETVKDALLIQPGDIYSPEKIRMATETVKDLYGRKGYIDTHVQFSSTPHPELNEYSIHFTIEEGSLYKIGLIRIVGNEQTKNNVILRESLLVPGEVFDSVRLKATQERLQNIGYFKSVNVYSVRSQDDKVLGGNYRDVYIEVEEMPTGHASVFFQANSGELVGGLDVTESNFNYKGFTSLFQNGFSSLRGGGEYAHAKISLGSKQRSYTMSWITPYFHETKWRVGVEGFLSQSHIQAKEYKIDSLGGSLFASYPLTPYWTLSSKYRAKHANIDVSTGASPQEQTLEKGTGNISAASISFNFDSTDRISKPHHGFRSLLEFEFAGLLGDVAFLKYNYINSFYQHLWHHGTLKYKWEAKFIQPIFWTSSFNSIPVSERFFIGGLHSVRGFKDFDLGPHFPNGDPQGGITASVLSLEYNHELLKMLDGFLFVDAGSLSQKPFQIDRYQASYGLGIRVEVMNKMPVTIGYGIPIHPLDPSQVQKFFFSMGGQF
ncbi:outer membrane protein assembly factor BamA [Rhabdochlamydiaceae symbiont of Dictyostelium giganteum]|uniref:outer membrane protein assembly factor BamA n=1 Tax=Rhabdochlamydiaceae symbiont of Dictyostelium giganteum TaxID=3342349 RepID=UPI00384DA04D